MFRKILAAFFLIAAVNVLIAREKYDDIAQLYTQGKYHEVITYADSCLSKDGINSTLWYYKGLAQYALYKYNEAVNSFENAALHSVDKTAILFLLGNALESSGNDIQAIDRYKELIAIDSMHIPAKARLANVYKSQKEYLPAIELFSDLIKMDSSNGYFYAQLAYCCNKFGLNEPVISYYEKALELNSYDMESGRNLINEFINQKYYEDATHLVDTLLIRFPNNMYLLKQKAYISAIGGNYLDAIQDFQTVVNLGDSSLFTAKYYGQSLYNNGQYDQAIFWLSRYIKNNEDDTKNQFILALAYQKDYQYQKSIEHLHISLGQVFDEELISRVYRETGITYAMYGDYLSFRDSTGLKAPEMYKIGVENYLRALELTSDNYKMYKVLGEFYETKIKDLKVALYYYEKCYKEFDPKKLDEDQLDWIQNKITKLKEEIHFMGE